MRIPNSSEVSLAETVQSSFLPRHGCLSHVISRPAALSPEARTRTFSLLEVFAAPRFQARVGAPGGGGEGTGEAPRRLGTGAEREP